MEAAQIDPIELQFQKDLIQRRQTAEAAIATWLDFLGMKYELAKGDYVDGETGAIVRQSKAEAETTETPPGPPADPYAETFETPTPIRPEVDEDVPAGDVGVPWDREKLLAENVDLVKG